VPYQSIANHLQQNIPTTQATWGWFLGAGVWVFWQVLDHNEIIRKSSRLKLFKQKQTSFLNKATRSYSRSHTGFGVNICFEDNLTAFWQSLWHTVASRAKILKQNRRKYWARRNRALAVSANVADSFIRVSHTAGRQAKAHGTFFFLHR